MSQVQEWAFPEALQPSPEELRFDLAHAIDAVVLVRTFIPEDAFTAGILGTERAGYGVVIRADGLVLTIGYLLTEASTIWLTTNRGDVVNGWPLAYDQATGFGLIQPLGALAAPWLERGSASGVAVGDRVTVLGHGGRIHALKTNVVAKREFAGYWEYVLDEALFTTPPHPAWSGAALVDDGGRLVGIGSLFVQEEFDGETVKGNMFVPIDLLAPIFDAMVTSGRPPGPGRAWLGMYTVDYDGGLVVSALADRGPAEQAGVQPGDIVAEVAGERVSELAEFFRRVWRQGPPGTEVPLTLLRGGSRVQVVVRAGNRTDFLRKPRLQ